jgi:hypothetical protein
MPHSPEHQQRKLKNFLLFGIILLIVAVSFSVTIIKMKTASEISAANKKTAELNASAQKEVDQKEVDQKSGEPSPSAQKSE